MAEDSWDHFSYEELGRIAERHWREFVLKYDENRALDYDHMTYALAIQWQLAKNLGEDKVEIPTDALRIVYLYITNQADALSGNRFSAADEMRVSAAKILFRKLMEDDGWEYEEAAIDRVKEVFGLRTWSQAYNWVKKRPYRFDGLADS